MATQSQGIQQLLQAEKRAAEKVAEARKSKFLNLEKVQTLKFLIHVLFSRTNIASEKSQRRSQR